MEFAILSSKILANNDRQRQQFFFNPEPIQARLDQGLPNMPSLCQEASSCWSLLGKGARRMTFFVEALLLVHTAGTFADTLAQVVTCRHEGNFTDSELCWTLGCLPEITMAKMLPCLIFLASFFSAQAGDSPQMEGFQKCYAGKFNSAGYCQGGRVLSGWRLYSRVQGSHGPRDQQRQQLLLLFRWWDGYRFRSRQDR